MSNSSLGELSQCINSTGVSSTTIPTWYLAINADAWKSQSQGLSQGVEETANQDHGLVQAYGQKSGHCSLFLIEMSENDINHRRTVYNVGRLGKEEEEAKRKKE